MTWHFSQLCGFDLETTGVDPENDRIVTAAIVLDGGGKEPERETWLINPGIDIPEGAYKVHGISTEHAREHGADPADAIDEISAILADQVETYGVPIVAMNAPFDLTMLDRELRRHGQRTLEDRLGGAIAPVVDPRVLDKQVDPYRKGSRNLGALCAHYGVVLDGAHEAAADALAAVRVSAAIAEKYPLVQGDVMELHARQVKWAKAQQLNLAAHFRRTPGKEHQAEGMRTAWPLIPFEGVQA